jgi:hypothetical protein
MAMTHHRIALAIGLLVASAAASPARAQTVLLRSVASNGFTSAEAGGKRLVGTVGQPAVGTTQSSTGIVHSGYWQRQGGLVTADEPAPDLPTAFAVHQNYPNPFNPTTTVTYDLPEPSEMALSVFDVLGRRVRLLASGAHPAGTHQVRFDASGLPSGIYFYTLKAGRYTETRRMVLLR